MNSFPLPKKELKAYIKDKSRDGKITCATLRKIAEVVGVTYKEAGKAANELKIKIRNCDLGCF